jgi:DNA-binding beta-propeller fold protein YncE
VIDGPTRTVTATIPVNSASGHSLAVDSVTHTVYVTNTADGTVSVIERR